MKGTIKNTVNEVYNTNQATFKKNIYNFDEKLNTFNRNNENVGANIKSNTNANSNSRVSEQGAASVKTVSTLMFILPTILVFIIIGGLATLIYLFRDNFIKVFNEVFRNDEIESKMNALEKQVADEKEQNKSLAHEMNAVKKEKESKEKELKEKESKEKGSKEKESKKSKEKGTDNKGKDEKIKPRIVNNDTLKQNYTPSSIVDEDGFCYIGTDDNMRHCVSAYAGDICTSGDVYKRMDDCLIPKLPSLESCVPSFN